MLGFLYLQVAKVVHAFVAAHLPLSVYCFTFVWKKTQAAAILAAIFVAFSEHLTTFGVHTIISSFLAPFVFATVTLQLKSMENIHKKRTYDRSKHVNGHTILTDAVAYGNGHYKESDDTHDHIHPKYHGGQTATPTGTNHNDSKNGAETKYSKMSRFGFIYNMGLSFFITLLCYIRPDLVLFYGVVSVVLYLRRAHQMEIFIRATYKALCSGAMLGLLLCGYVDKRVHGIWLVSPLQWVKFNLLSKTSGLLFGEEKTLWYVEKLIDSSAVFHCQFVIVVGCLVSFALTTLISRKTPGSPRLTMDILTTLLLLFTTYSIQTHKEMRFLHNTLVCFHVLTASVMNDCLCTLRDHMVFNITKVTRILSYTLAITLLANIYVQQKFGVNVAPTQRSWLYKEASYSGHVNKCLDFIGHQNDVTGVFLDYSIHTTMAFTVIHKNIPLLTLVHDEYYEFNIFVQKSLPSSNFFRQSNVSVYTFSNPANFIVRENYPFLLKYLLENHVYNYVIYGSSSAVQLFGYKEVYSSGDTKVFRRIHNASMDDLLQTVASQLTKVLNYTYLEYEAQWLLTFAKYDKAIERLNFTLTSEKPTVRALHLLITAYKRQGNSEKARSIYHHCVRTYNIETCNQPQSNIKLRSYRNLDSIRL